MRTVSIGNMIKSIVGMLGTRDLSTWENSFIRSVAEQSNQGTDTSKLSDKQVEMVDSIFREHFA